METLFIVVSSRYNSPSTLHTLRQYLIEVGAEIDAEGTASRPTVELCGSQCAVLSGSAEYWSMCPSHEALRRPFAAALCPETTLCLAEEDAKSAFYNCYGELWDAVVAEKRLQTASDVVAEKNIAATELEQLCAVANAGDVLELPTHLTITRLRGGKSTGSPREPCVWYVVNGSHPAQQHRFFEPGADSIDCWWCAASLPSSPRQQQQGQTVELHQLSLGIERFFPSKADVWIAINPLEALAFRVAWMQVPLARDAFASAALQRCIPISWLEALLRNPALDQNGHLCSAFDRTSGMRASEAIDAVTTLWNEVQQVQEAGDEGVAAGVPALYDHEKGLFSPSLYAVTANENRKHAVAFVHPRISVHNALSVSLQDRLTQQGARVDAVRPLSAEEVHAKLDLHFGPVARYALDQEALQRLVVEDADTAAEVTTMFRGAHSDSWQRAMEEGRIWSVSLAEKMLGCQPAYTLLKNSIQHNESTTQLSAAVAVTKISHQALVAQHYPETAVRELFSQSASATAGRGNVSANVDHRPLSRTPDNIYVVNAAYGVYRHDVLFHPSTGDHSCEVWQLSWSEETERRLCDLPSGASAKWFGGLYSLQEDKSADAALATQAEAAYSAEVGVDVCRLFPLVHVVDAPGMALRARHLWWGTPYDEDVLSRQLRLCGQSWVALLPPLSSSAAFLEAVLVLSPQFSTSQTVPCVHAVLRENEATIVDESDLYGEEAADYVFGGNSLLAVASSFAHQSGAALWEVLPHELRSSMEDAADSIRMRANEFVAPVSPDNLMGGAVACAALQLTVKAFAEAWHAAEPCRLDRVCWLAFLPQHDVWVLNGHVPLLEHRYSAETTCVHLLRIRWPASSNSWAGMQLALIGDGIEGATQRKRDDKDSVGAHGTDTTGSLSLLLSRTVARQSRSEWAEGAVEPLCLLSPTPYDALIDVLRWPRRGSSNPMRSEVALEDWLLQQSYIRARLTDSVACPLALLVQQVRETLANVREVHQPHRCYAVLPQWISHATQTQRDTHLHHGFVWLHPSSATPTVLKALPHLLEERGVRIRACGALPLRDATERQLLDVHHDSFFKSAFVRTAAQVPITDGEARIFAMSFGQSWINAVQLGLVLNAQEAEQRYGAVHLTTWWDSLPDVHKARLSDQLLIGYMAEEGLYVMNPPYSYRRARLYAGGSEVVWYSLIWPAQAMTWEAFLTTVVGDSDPTKAAPGSLRCHFSENWTRYSLPGKPDQMDCVLHASASPLAALAERCRWLGCTPESDPYGCVLLRSGVHAALLRLLLSNPILYTCSSGIMTEAFHSLRQEDVQQLIAQLRDYACQCEVMVIPDSVSLVPPPGLLELSGQVADAGGSAGECSSLAEQLRAYRGIALQKAVDIFQLCAFATSFSDEIAPSADADDDAVCSAVLYLDPIQASSDSGEVEGALAPSPVAVQAVCRFVEQHLRHCGVRVVHERMVKCASEAEARVLYRQQHQRLYRYGIEVPAWETITSNPFFQVKMKQHFDASFQCATSMVLRNAAEMADALQGSGRDVAALWRRARRLYPRDSLVLSDDCVVQRLHPRKPLFLLNGDAMEAEEEFAVRQAKTGVHVWYIQWNTKSTTGMSYARLGQIIASLQSARGGLRECWQTYRCDSEGSAHLTAAANDSCPLLHVSESSLAAVRQRQLWWKLPLSTDPIVRRWLADAPNQTMESATALPPRAITWALQDPKVLVNSTGASTFLCDAVTGMDAACVRDRLREWWAAVQDSQRNSAVIALMPQAAANCAVRHLVRAVIAEQGLRIEEYGFVAHQGGVGRVEAQQTVQCVCPEDWSYATNEPHLLSLSTEECDRVAAVFQSTWSSLIDSGRLLPASRATKRLGGMSAAQLQLFVKAAGKSMWVRPHLHLAELEEYGVVVINAHVAHLTNAIAESAQRTPLPYYVVSWDPCKWSWEECVTSVAGAAEPSAAALDSIRGRINASWSALGLRSAPTMGDSVVYMSEGPVHSMLTRLRLRQPAMDALDQDEFGGVLVQQLGAAVVPVLREWLSNLMITCDGRTDGVLSHLARWNTDEVFHLLEHLVHAPSPPLPSNLSAVRREDHDAEGRRAAEAAWKAAVQQRDSLPSLMNSAKSLHAPFAAGDGGDSVLLHRNHGTLLFFDRHLDEAQKAELRHHLHQHGVSVSTTEEALKEQEVTPGLLDRLFPTASFFANCPEVAAVLLASREVALADQERFGTVFHDEAGWTSMLERTVQHATCASHGLYSASDAMRLWQWTPQDLWTKVQGGLTMQLSEGIEVTRLPCDCAEAAEDVTHPHQDARGDVEELSFARQAPWAGQFVVNGAYAALRAAVQEISCAAETKAAGSSVVKSVNTLTPCLTIWEVSWDSRTLSWQDFVRSVIGCADCDRAVDGSFNAIWGKASRAKSDESECVSSPLSSWGVMSASGPIAAFAMRMRWCRNADNRYNAYVPDPFVRAMAMAGVVDDASFVEGWFSDPLVKVSRDAASGTEAQRRLFDWTRGCDTPQVLQWLWASGATQAPLSAEDHSAVARDGATAEAAAERDGQDKQNSSSSAMAPPPPRRKKQLRDARTQDALLHARTEYDWRRLWDYYSALGDPTAATGDEPPTAVDVAAANAAAAASTTDTIPFASFYRDFKSLDAFGVPSMSHELKMLFINIEVAGRGRMTYTQFVRALTLYQSL